MQTVQIKGMSCQHCAKAVTDALLKLDGVTNAEVSLENGEARIEEETSVDREAIETAVRNAGYEVTGFS